MYYKAERTGTMESWGCGIHNPEAVFLFDRGYFALKPGNNVDDLVNPTITIRPCDKQEIADLKVKYEIPEDWDPSNF